MNTNKLPKDLCYVLRMHMHVELHVQICAIFLVCTSGKIEMFEDLPHHVKQVV